VVLQQELTGLKSQLTKLEREQSSGNGDLKVPTNQIPDAGLAYIRGLRGVSYYQTVFELLAKQYEIAKLDEARDAQVIQVVDQAIRPDKKYSPKRALIIAIAAFLSFLLALLWVSISEALRRAKSRPDEQVRLQRIRHLIENASRTVHQ
jgi:tyrosine-protein kinase Etk/Wzc